MSPFVAHLNLTWSQAKAFETVDLNLISVALTISKHDNAFEFCWENSMMSW